MKDRIKLLRKSTGMTQAAFGEAVGVSLSAEQKWELGISVPSDAAVILICSRFGVRKDWLLRGEGPMRAESWAAVELSELADRLFLSRPESFKARLIAALLRYDADGAQWQILEDIYRSVAAELDTASPDTPAAGESGSDLGL